MLLFYFSKEYHDNLFIQLNKHIVFFSTQVIIYLIFKGTKMDNFLTTISQYIAENNLPYSAHIENKIVYKNLVLSNEDGDKKVFKIEPFKKLPPSNMCHSSVLFVKVDPYNQTKKWIHEVLNDKHYANKMKLK